jgi:hypothetical protein
MATKQVSVMLDIGTQTILLREVTTAHCRCGKSLRWQVSDNPSLSATASCACGVDYVAWLAEVKIEGINRGAM